LKIPGDLHSDFEFDKHKTPQNRQLRGWWYLQYWHG